MAAGVDNPATIKVIDRRDAIRGALAAAIPGDIVLILGQGPRDRPGDRRQSSIPSTTVVWPWKSWPPWARTEIREDRG